MAQLLTQNSKLKKTSKAIDAGYADAMSNDLMATKWFNDTNKVGLVFH